MSELSAELSGADAAGVVVVGGDVALAVAAVLCEWFGVEDLMSACLCLDDSERGRVLRGETALTNWAAILPG